MPRPNNRRRLSITGKIEAGWALEAVEQAKHQRGCRDLKRILLRFTNISSGVRGGYRLVGNLAPEPLLFC